MNAYSTTPYYPVHRPTDTSLEMGKVGAVVGLCGAGAVNLRRLRQGQITATDAAVDTLRAGMASGLATAAAMLVANQFRSPALALLATVATGTAVMYSLNAEQTSGDKL